MKSHDSYFVHFFKYLTRYVLQTCYVDVNLNFLSIQPKFCENPMLLLLLAKMFFCWFLCIFSMHPKFLRAPWLYDVTVTSYEVQWYSFWYQWIEEVHTYTLVANIGVSDVLYRKSREEVATPPPSEDVLQKYRRRMRVKAGISMPIRLFV